MTLAEQYAANRKKRIEAGNVNTYNSASDENESNLAERYAFNRKYRILSDRISNTNLADIYSAVNKGDWLDQKSINSYLTRVNSYLNDLNEFTTDNYHDKYTATQNTKSLYDALVERSKIFSQYDSKESYETALATAKAQKEREDYLSNYDFDMAEGYMEDLQEKKKNAPLFSDERREAAKRYRAVQKEYNQVKRSGVVSNEYTDLQNNADFEEKSMALNPVTVDKNAKAGTSYDDKLGVYLSATDEDLRDVERQLSGNHRSVYVNTIQEGNNSYWNELKPEEIKTYYYLMNTKGQDAAYEYLDNLAVTLGKRNEQTVLEDMNDANTLQKIAYNIASVPVNVLGSVPAYISDQVNLALGNDINPYDAVHTMSNWSSAVRSTTAEDINELTHNVSIPYLEFGAGDAYQALMSGVDSILGAGLLGNMYTVTMGMNSAVSQAKELYENGASNIEIALLSNIAGAIEYITEKVSLDKFLSDKMPATWKEYAKSIFAQAGVEASEEMFSEIGNTIAQALILKEDSEWKQLIDNGGFLNALSETAKKVLNAGVGGAISGGAMAAGGVGLKMKALSNVYDESSVGQALESDPQNVTALINQGLVMPVDSEAYQLAEKLSQKESEGKSITKLEKANLVIANQQIIDQEQNLEKLGVDKSVLTTDEKAPSPVSIASLDKNGVPTVNLDNKTQASVKDIAFKDAKTAAVYTNLESMGITDTGTANAVIQAQLSGDMATTEQRLGFNEAFQLGRINASLDAVENPAFMQNLTATQKQVAYDLGKSYENKLTTEKQAKLAPVIGKEIRSGKITLPKSFAKMSDIQRASVAVFARINSDITHSEVIMYESVLDENGKRVYSESIPGTDAKKGELAANGFYQNGKVYIDINAGNTGRGSILWTASHEFTHLMAQAAPESYQKLADFVTAEFGKRNIDVNQYISKQLSKMKDSDGNPMEDNPTNRKKAHEEVIADAMTEMLASDDVVQRLADLKQSDKTLWQKLKDFFTKLYQKITKSYAELEDTLLPDEAYQLRKFTDSIGKIKDLFAEGLVAAGNQLEQNVLSAKENRELTAKGLTVKNGVVMADNIAAQITASDTLFPQAIDHSPRTLEEWKALLYDKYGRSESTDRMVNALFSFTNTLISDDAIKIVPNGEYANKGLGPIRTNQEYIWTFDMDTSCPRTFQFLAYRDQIRRVAGRDLTYDESIFLLELMRAYGQQLPCTYCYVENKRILLAASYNNYFAFRNAVMSEDSDSKAMTKMYGYKKGKPLPEASQKVFDTWRDDRSYNPSIEEVWRQTQQARNAVLAYLDEQYNNGTITPKSSKLNSMVKERFGITERAALSEVQGFVSEWVYDTLAEKEHDYIAGFDETIDEIDQRALVLNHEAVAYAKSSSSAKLVENYAPYAGQLSKISEEDKKYIIGMGGIRKHSSNDFRIDYVQDYFMFFADLAAGEWTGHTYTKNTDYGKIFGNSGDRINMSIAMYGDRLDNIRPNEQEGAIWKDVQELRRVYPNVGAMAMVTTDAQLSFALNADWIDMIIPFHASSLDKKVWYDLRNWLDYTSKQLERFLNSNEMTLALLQKELSDNGIEYDSSEMNTALLEISNEMGAGANAKETSKIIRKEITRLRNIAKQNGLNTFVKGTDIAAIYDATFAVKRIYAEDGSRVKPHFLPGDTVVKGNIIPGHHNDVELYKKLCQEYGVNPRFKGVAVTDANGNLVDITNHDGYIKVLKETARIDTEQKPIQFNFDQYDDYLGMSPFDYAMERLRQEYRNGGYSNNSADAFGIVDEFCREYLGKTEKDFLDAKHDYKGYGWLTERAQNTRDVILEDQEKISSPGEYYTYFDNKPEFKATENSVTMHSVREEDPPSKTLKAYKLMRLTDGNLYPLFIGNNEKIVPNTWYNADSPNLSQLKLLPAGTHLIKMSTGEATSWDDYAKDHVQKYKNGNYRRSNPNVDDIHWANDNGYRFMYIEEKSGEKSEGTMLKQYGDTRAYYNWGVNGSKKTETGEGSPSIYALRPGFHFGETTSMSQIGYDGDDGSTVRLDNQVWVEVEMAADVDYNSEAESNWGGDIPTHIPVNGYYKFATNPTQKKSKSGASESDNTKADWYVAGAFKVNRILSDSEADRIVIEYNKRSGKNVPLDYRREGGRVFNAETMSLEDPKTIMYSSRDQVPLGTIFSAGDTFAYALHGIVKTQFAVENRPEIVAVYQNNHDGFVYDNALTLDPKQMEKVQYLMVTPPCVNLSGLRTQTHERPIDKELAKKVAEIITETKPRAFSLENVPVYMTSESLNKIRAALKKAGYKSIDISTYKDSDYGGYTNRERTILRAMRDEDLPPVAEKTPQKNGWISAVGMDYLNSLPDAKSVNPRMIQDLNQSGINPYKVNRPLFVFGESYKNRHFGHAFGNQVLPTIMANSGASRVFMPDGTMKEATPELLAKLSGLDGYKLPEQKVLARDVIGNGIPAAITNATLKPIADYLQKDNKQRIEKGQDIRYSARDSEGNNLSPEQIEFFKDSKVRDENGNLLVVYHGTPDGGFTVFNPSQSMISDNPSVANWFTNNKDIVNKYYNVDNSRSDNGKQIYSGHLNITNPLVVNANGDAWNNIKVSQNLRDGIGYKYSNYFTDEIVTSDRVSTERIAKYAKDTGYDGVIINNVRDGSIYEDSSNVYAAFDSNQFKNIDNTTPTSDPDIRYSVRDHDYAAKMQKLNDRLTAQNEKLTQDVKDLKDLLKLQGKETEGLVYTKQSIEATAKKLMRENNAKGDLAEFSGKLLEAYNLLNNAIKNPDEEVETGFVENTLNPVGKWLLDNQKDNNERPYYEQSVLDFMRGHRVYISPEMRNEIEFLYGSYKDFRDQLMGTLIVTQNPNDEALADYWNNSLVPQFPATFSEEAVDKNIPSMLTEAVAELKSATVGSSDETAYMRSMMLPDTNMSVLDAFWDTKTAYTVADKYADKIKKLKEKHSQNMADLRAEKYEAIKAVRESDREMRDRALSRYRESAIKKQNEIKQRYEERIVKARDRKDMTALRNKILRTVKELDSLLAADTKKHHVLDSMKRVVADSLDLINRDIVIAQEKYDGYTDAYGNYHKGLLEQLENAKTEEERAELLARAENIQKRDFAFQDKISALKTRYDAIKKDPALSPIHDEAISNKIESVSEWVQDTPLGLMTRPQLEDVYDMYQMILHSVKNADKAFRQGRWEDAVDGGTAIMDEIRAVREQKTERAVATKPISEFVANELKPGYFVKYLGSATLERYYNALEEAESVYGRDMHEAKQFVEDVQKRYHVDSVDMERQYSLAFNNGAYHYSLTPQQMMSVYAYSKREQALKHMSVGGFVDRTQYKKTKTGKDGKVKKSILMYESTSPTSFRMSEDDLRVVKNQLQSLGLIGYVDEMQNYLSSVMGKKGNEATQILYGIDLFKEGFYFPLKSDSDFMASSNQPAGEKALKESGFTKEVTPGASNPIALENFDDVFARHVNEMSNYHAFVVPIDNLNKVLNYTNFRDAEAGTSLKRTIVSGFSRAEVIYLSQLIKDLNGGARSASGAGDLFSSLIGTYKKTAVAAKVSVILQQPTAILRAMSMIDPKYFHKNEQMSVTEKWELIKKYAPVAVIKEMGGHDTGSGKSAQRYLMGDSGFMAKLDEKTMAGAEYADMLGWSWIWDACMNEAADTDGLSGVTLYQAAGRRFERVVRDTQVYDSTLSRSGYMRSQKEIVKQATAFMGEPTMSANMMFNALLQAKRGKITKAAATRTISFVMLASIAAAWLKSIPQAAEDDDKEKNYLEKLIGKISSNTVDELFVWNLLPFVKDITSIANGFSVERMDTALISDLANAVKKFDSASATTYKKIETFAYAISNLLGIPFKNVWKTLKGIGLTVYQTIRDSANGTNEVTGKGIERTIRSEVFGKTESQQILSDIEKGIKRGDFSKMKSYADEMLKAKTDAGKDASKARSEVQSALTGQFREPFLEAYRNNDTETMANIRKALNATGIYKDIVEMTQQWIKDSNK